MKLRKLLNEISNSQQDAEIINHFKSGGTYSNDMTYQYFIQPKRDVENGSYFRYDLHSGKYKKFPNLKSFLRAIRKSLKYGN